jgi:phosphatidylserine decarboxylase
VFNALKLALHYLLPKYSLSRLAGRLADCHAGLLTRWLIQAFIRYYRVDMQEALLPQPSSYKTFNEFFTRHLRSEVRPISGDDSELVSPVDGTVSQLGCIDEYRLVQAKGHDYQLDQLLAGDAELVKTFQGGQFATLYLSPRDYHRVHMPCDGRLQQMIYVPGARFSVGSFTTQHVPNLFARNERVIAIFETAFGPLAQILVGAAIVGSIHVVWAGQVISWAGTITQWLYSPEESIFLKRGSEMGYFKLGSTVINLFAPNRISLASHWVCGQAVKLGEPYAQRVRDER